MLQEIEEKDTEEEIEEIISYSEETEFLAMLDNALQKKKSIPVIESPANTNTPLSKIFSLTNILP